MASLWRLYTKALDKRPLVTLSISTGALMGTGDVLAQFAVQRRSFTEYEPVRTGRFVLFGICIAGPALHKWYSTLAKLYPASSSLAPVKMMLTDQVLFAPCFLGVFISTMSVMRGETSNQLVDRLKADYPEVLLTNYKVWPAVQLVNFYFVPLHLRVMFANVVALFWNTYLAWRSEREPAEQEGS